MEENHQERLSELEGLSLFITGISSKIGNVLKTLNWDEEHLLQVHFYPYIFHQPKIVTIFFSCVYRKPRQKCAILIVNIVFLKKLIMIMLKLVYGPKKVMEMNYLYQNQTIAVHLYYSVSFSSFQFQVTINLHLHRTLTCCCISTRVRSFQYFQGKPNTHIRVLCK